MKKELIVFVIIASLVSCKDQPSQKEFEVNGTIGNNTAKMIYLEQIPVATMQPVTVDSAIIGKDGKFLLKTEANEATVYNLRLDRGVYPIASVINDTSKVTVNATLSKENSLFAENYEVKGSRASQKMKDFMYAFNGMLQAIFYNSRHADSLQKSEAADSILAILQDERTKIASNLKNLTLESIGSSGNPALTMFELGYYQSTANNPAFQLEAFNNDEVSKIVDEVAGKFPSHKGVELVKKSLDEQMQKPGGWVGQPAPEISLPDINGKEIKLSSFRGKYVLVDFWASWCGPCRQENPNVVMAFNKLKNKNFTVFGVSLDEEKDAWVNAIQKDGLTWTQVSDLKYWNSIAVSLYHIDGIPYNVLVDPKGMIIAENLRGSRLETKLEEVLQ